MEVYNQQPCPLLKMRHIKNEYQDDKYSEINSKTNTLTFPYFQVFVFIGKLEQSGIQSNLI